MITIQLLEAADVFYADDWCRPLALCTMSGGHSDSMSYKNMYSGRPENNVEWVRVKHVIGSPWWGTTVGKYTKACGKYEFVRGNLPRSHQLSMSGYSTSSLRVRNDEYDDPNDDIPF